MFFGFFRDFEFSYNEPLTAFRDVILYVKGYYLIQLDYTKIDDIDVFQKTNMTLTINGTGNNKM